MEKITQDQTASFIPNTQEQDVYGAKDVNVQENTSSSYSPARQSLLNLEIIRKHRRWYFLKGRIIELVIEFTDRKTGKIKCRGKIFYQVRKKQFYYIRSDQKIFFSSIHYCLTSYKEYMEKILYANN